MECLVSKGATWLSDGWGRWARGGGKTTTSLIFFHTNGTNPTNVCSVARYASIRHSTSIRFFFYSTISATTNPKTIQIKKHNSLRTSHSNTRVWPPTRPSARKMKRNTIYAQIVTNQLVCVFGRKHQYSQITNQFHSFNTEQIYTEIRQSVIFVKNLYSLRISLVLLGLPYGLHQGELGIHQVNWWW